MNLASRKIGRLMMAAGENRVNLASRESQIAGRKINGLQSYPREPCQPFFNTMNLNLLAYCSGWQGSQATRARLAKFTATRSSAQGSMSTC